jgi:hypothetical protein
MWLTCTAVQFVPAEVVMLRARSTSVPVQAATSPRAPPYIIAPHNATFDPRRLRSLVGMPFRLWLWRGTEAGMGQNRQTGTPSSEPHICLPRRKCTTNIYRTIAEVRSLVLGHGIITRSLSNGTT